MPNGPAMPTAGSASARSSGPNTSPAASIEPSITITMRPVARRRPALAAAAHPVPGARASTSTPSPKAAGSSPVTSATT